METIRFSGLNQSNAVFSQPLRSCTLAAEITESMDTLRVALTEDIAALAKTMQEKIALFPELEFAFTARHGKDLLEKLEKDHDLDLILMDINMPVMDGISATKEVRKRYPDIKIIMSTVFDEEDYIFQSIMAGANGYLLKDEKPQKILFSIQEAMEGGAPMSAGIASKALGLIRKMADVGEDPSSVGSD